MSDTPICPFCHQPLKVMIAIGGNRMALGYCDGPCKMTFAISVYDWDSPVRDILGREVKRDGK